MRNALLPIALLAITSTALAQNCFDGNLGVLLGANTQDTVFPIQPIGFAFPLGGATYTDIHVNDHGFVQLSNAGVPAPLLTNDPQLYTPITSNFAAGAPKIAPLYADIIAFGGGDVWLRSSPTECVVTWRSMQSFGVANPRFTFQLAIYPSGLIRFVYGPNVSHASTWGGSSDNAIAGVTPAQGAILPGSVDLSAGGSSASDSTFENWAIANGFDMQNNTLLLIPTVPGYTYSLLGAPANCASTLNYGQGCDGLALTAANNPTLGNAAFTLRISGVPVVSPVAFVAFGSAVVNPGIPLDPIGMAGCLSYTSFDIGLFTSGPVSAGVSDMVFGIPSSPALVAAILATQGVALTTTTALGLNASNGTQMTVGYGF